MKSSLLSSVSIALLVFASLQATYPQTLVPGGYVSGTWTAAGSPYLVQGSITIHADSMLTIEPGVDVNFQGLYSLTVNGLLEAFGTETDSIHFFPADINVSWWGIRFENAPGSSHLAYCTVSHSGTIFFGTGGIICTNSNPVIIHCRISNNNNRTVDPTYAGGITLNNSNAEISWCNITNNYSGQNGGGINIYNSNPVITGCNISSNAVIQYGGGICIHGSSNPVITNCNIENNMSNIYGGGISALGSVVTISECNIGYNHAETGGGGISLHSGSVFLDHCIIEHNNCLSTGNGKGGGIYTDSGTLTVAHCTFYWNEIEQQNPYGQEIYTEGNAAMTVNNSIINSLWNFHTFFFNSNIPASVSYDDFKGETGPGTNRFMGNVPPGLGVLTQANTNGDSCDMFYNIFLDPLFEDPGSGNYQITWSNWPAPDLTKSPCIDAGDPSSPPDSDGTVTDMGVFSFDQNIPVELAAFTAELNEDFVLLKWITATETNNRGFEIERKQESSDWIKIGFLKGHGTTTEPNTYSYSDDIININEKSITYRLNQIDYDGSHQYSNEVVVENIGPQDFTLYQNYPNPFNPVTTIKYSIPEMSKVSLTLFNLLGKEVTTLFNKEKTAGNYTIELNAANLPSGIYFYQLRAVPVLPGGRQVGGQAGDRSTSSGQVFVQTKKMILLK